MLFTILIQFIPTTMARGSRKGSKQTTDTKQAAESTSNNVSTVSNAGNNSVNATKQQDSINVENKKLNVDKSNESLPKKKSTQSQPQINDNQCVGGSVNNSFQNASNPSKTTDTKQMAESTSNNVLTVSYAGNDSVKVTKQQDSINVENKKPIVDKSNVSLRKKTSTQSQPQSQPQKNDNKCVDGSVNNNAQNATNPPKNTDQRNNAEKITVKIENANNFDKFVVIIFDEIHERLKSVFDKYNLLNNDPIGETHTTCSSSDIIIDETKGINIMSIISIFLEAKKEFLMPTLEFPKNKIGTFGKNKEVLGNLEIELVRSLHKFMNKFVSYNIENKYAMCAILEIAMIFNEFTDFENMIFNGSYGRFAKEYINFFDQLAVNFYNIGFKIKKDLHFTDEEFDTVLSIISTRFDDKNTEINCGDLNYTLVDYETSNSMQRIELYCFFTIKSKQMVREQYREGTLIREKEIRFEDSNDIDDVIKKFKEHQNDRKDKISEDLHNETIKIQSNFGKNKSRPENKNKFLGKGIDIFRKLRTITVGPRIITTLKLKMKI